MPRRGLVLAVLATGCSAGERGARAPEPAAGPAMVIARARDAGTAPVTIIDAAAMASLDAGAAPAAPIAGEPEVELAVLQGFPGLDLVESSNHAFHEHGGDAAKISHAALTFEVRDGRAHVIAVHRIELLRAHCREDTWHDRTRLTITGYEAYAWTSHDPIATGRARVTLPAGDPQRYGVTVRFAPVAAYQACDRFGFAIDLVVDGARFQTEIPLDVTRFEPLRP